MKKTISIALAAGVLFGVLSLSAYANPEEEPVSQIEPYITAPADDGIPQAEPYLVIDANDDLTAMPAIIRKFRNGTFKYDETKFDTSKECVDETLGVISERNSVILPFDVDINTIEPGDSNFAFTGYGMFSVDGEFDGLKYSITNYFTTDRIESIKKSFSDSYLEKRNAVSREIGGLTVTGIWEESDDLDYCNFFFETSDGFFQIYVKGAENFDAAFDKINLTVYPLVNGFVHSNGKIYYNKDGAFLKGWYKIGGSRYYFKKDGSAATNITKIGGTYCQFEDGGVYIGKFTGTAKIGKKTIKFVDGVIVN
jgi:hypothetical protein